MTNKSPCFTSSCSSVASSFSIGSASSPYQLVLQKCHSEPDGWSYNYIAWFLLRASQKLQKKRHGYVQVLQTGWKTTLDEQCITHCEKQKNEFCSICEYSCRGKSLLRIHVESVHEGKKPNACLMCDYRCSTKSRLKSHVDAVHEKTKQFSCTVCNHLFESTLIFLTSCSWKSKAIWLHCL